MTLVIGRKGEAEMKGGKKKKKRQSCTKGNTFVLTPLKLLMFPCSQVLTMNLLHGRHCARHWRYRDK